ncbi:thioesterase II family protein [Streptomyces sp. NPDC058274]|uniref:thioesterase II family protein n=1 Tax=Streptomyces sp. NPDC058274 TaxID=3346416 RepID=UPI0036EDAB2D
MITRPRPVARPAMRLFLFHHAGGSARFYADWATSDDFPDDWEICLLDAPGRGQAADAPPARTLGELADFCRQGLLPWLDRPYAFFGHSMGALAAYETAHRLAEHGEPGPRWLGVSACAAPTRTAAQPGDRHLLDDDALRTWARRAGGTPPEILEHPTVWRMFAGLLRSDLHLVDTWRANPAPNPPRPPLRTPLTAFGGTADPTTPPAHLTAWHPTTRHWQGLHLYPGGHFYLQQHRPEVTRAVIEGCGASASVTVGAPPAE